MVDPGGIANWSVTHVDWSEGKWNPRSYRAADVTYELLKNITVCLNLSKGKTYIPTCSQLLVVFHTDLFALHCAVCQ
jgi:hypothetical protein